MLSKPYLPIIYDCLPGLHMESVAMKGGGGGGVGGITLRLSKMLVSQCDAGKLGGSEGQGCWFLKHVQT